MSLMTFNLLADMLTYCEAFPHAEERHLAWPHRLELQIADIELHAPSILCLQELQGTPPGAGGQEERNRWAGRTSATLG